MTTGKKMRLCLVLALGAGCASTGAAKGPEKDPELARTKTEPRPAVEETEASKPETEKPKLEVSKTVEDAFDQAVDKAQKLLAESPPKCKAAAELFEDVADKNPKVLSARYNAGLAYEKCNLLKDAEAQYRKALAVNPRYANAIGGLGVIAWKQGDQRQAESYFRQALAIDLRCLPALVNMATILRERARSGDMSAVRDAQDDVRRALAVDGNNMSAYTTLALIYYDLAGNDRSKLEMAETVITQANKINDHWAPLWNVSGLVALRKKNVTRALRDFRKAVEIDSNFTEAQMNIGAITLSFRDYASAEQAFKAVLAREPKNIDAIVGLGVAYRGQRKFKDAEQQYQTAAKVDPRNCAVPYNLGLLYQDYMGGSEQELRRAQGYFHDFSLRCSQDREKTAEAERRTKNIDETIKALADAAQMQRESERIQKQQEEQQKRQKDEDQKKPKPASATEPGAGAQK